jgi:hypothetical protein
LKIISNGPGREPFFKVANDASLRLEGEKLLQG